MQQSRRALIASARASDSFAHNVNRGSNNEHLIREFLINNLPSALVRVTSGEIVGQEALNEEDLAHKVESARQRDVILYSPFYPVMRPPGGSSELCLVPDEAVIAIVEVKTSLSNEDLKAEIASAARGCAHLNHFVFAFKSEVSLDALIPADQLPENLLAIFDMQHGTAAREQDSWALVEVQNTCPLMLFYAALMRCVYSHSATPPSVSPFDIGAYVFATDERFPRVCKAENDDEEILIIHEQENVHE